MTDLLELESAYLGMTPWARGKLMDAARDYLRNWPEPRKIASLTLVARPIQLDIPARRINGRINQKLTVFARKPVDGQ